MLHLAFEAAAVAAAAVALERAEVRATPRRHTLLADLTAFVLTTSFSPLPSNTQTTNTFSDLHFYDLGGDFARGTVRVRCWLRNAAAEAGNA